MGKLVEEFFPIILEGKVLSRRMLAITFCIFDHIDKHGEAPTGPYIVKRTGLEKTHVYYVLKTLPFFKKKKNEKEKLNRYYVDIEEFKKFIEKERKKKRKIRGKWVKKQAEVKDG